MPAVATLTSVCSGHGCFPSRSASMASSSVFATGEGIHRLNDSWDTHTCKSSHAGVLALGSGTVFANGLAVGRISDPIGNPHDSCSSTVETGSLTVFAGE